MPGDGMGIYWDGRARQNYVSVACWNHTPELADAKGLREAQYLRGIMAASPLGKAVGAERLTVLDIGGGYGRVAKHLSPHVARYILMDASGEMLLKATEHLAGMRVEFLQGDGLTLSGVADASVEFAFACMCFQHIDHEVTIGYLAELCRVLKPSAWAWFHVPPVRYPERLQHIAWKDWPGNLHHWSPDQMAEVCLRVGLSVVEMRFDEDPLEVLVERPHQDHLLRWMCKEA